MSNTRRTVHGVPMHGAPVPSARRLAGKPAGRASLAGPATATAIPAPASSRSRPTWSDRSAGPCSTCCSTPTAPTS